MALAAEFELRVLVFAYPKPRTVLSAADSLSGIPTLPIGRIPDNVSTDISLQSVPLPCTLHQPSHAFWENSHLKNPKFYRSSRLWKNSVHGRPALFRRLPLPRRGSEFVENFSCHQIGNDIIQGFQIPVRPGAAGQYVVFSRIIQHAGFCLE